MKTNYIKQINELEAKMNEQTQIISIDPVMEGKKWTNKVLVNETYLTSAGNKVIKNSTTLSLNELMDVEVLKKLFTGKVLINFSPINKYDLNDLLNKYIKQEPAPVDETIKELEAYLNEKLSKEKED